jgi:hypothetical protein
VGDTPLDERGLGGWVEVPLAAEARGLALRVSRPDGKAACVQLDEGDTAPDAGYVPLVLAGCLRLTDPVLKRRTDSTTPARTTS